MEEYAKDQGFHRVEEVTLAIGALSCVEIEALNFAFETVMKGLLAESNIEFKTIEGQARCQGRGQLTVREMLYDACEHCDHA